MVPLLLTFEHEGFLPYSYLITPPNNDSTAALSKQISGPSALKVGVQGIQGPTRSDGFMLTIIPKES